MPSALAAAAVLVLAGGVWGFFALQQRNNSALQSVPNTATTNQDPALAAPTAATGNNTSSQPVSEPKQVANQPHPAGADLTIVRKKQKPAQPAGKKTETPAAPEPRPPDRVGEGHADERAPADPQESNFPDVNPPNLPRRGRGGSRITAGGTVIRNLPDGTQVITTPDGTRVMVTPDGKRQVLRPGQKRNPGRVRPVP